VSYLRIGRDTEAETLLVKAMEEEQRVAANEEQPNPLVPPHSRPGLVSRSHC
jgi:hypothetical protein